MKKTFIIAMIAMLFLACGKKNPTADFHVIIPFPDSFQPEKINLEEGDEQTAVLYDIRGDVKQIIIISKYYYRSSKMFSEEKVQEVFFSNTKWLGALHDVLTDEEMRRIFEEEHLEFIQNLPEIEPSMDLPVLKMLLNVNNQYGRRLQSMFSLNGGKEDFPTMIHTLHHKERNFIIYLQYFRIRDGKGEPLEKYDEMTKAIENTRFF